VASLRTLRPATETPLELELRAADGTRLFATESEVALEEDGTATLTFEVASLPLLGGDYDLVFSAGGGAADRTVRFTVVSQPGAQGMIDLGGSWETLSAEATQ
jgi:hypothetical protein